MKRISVPDRYLLPVLAVALPLLGMLFADADRPELRTAMTLGAAVGISIVGFDLIFGLAKQLQLGHSFFLAVGAYGSGVLSTRFDWEPALSIVVSILAAVVLAYPLGLILLRLREFYFGAATFALGLLGLNVIVNLREYTGAEDGIAVKPLSIGSWTMSNPQTACAFTLVLGVVAVAIGRAYRRSPRGAAARVVGLDENAAAAQGIDPVAVKVEVFTISAAFGALGGAVYAHLVSYLFLTQFGLLGNIEAFVVSVVGGAGTVVGPFLFAIFVEMLPGLVSVFDKYPDLAIGLVLIVLLLVTDRVHELRSRPRLERSAPEPSPEASPAPEGAHA